MAEAVVSLVLQKLGDLLVQEATFLSGVSDQVEQVRKELKRMLCFLKDADTKQCKDESIRNWLREIRSLAYRIEDLVETYAIQVAIRKSSGRGIKKFLRRSTGIFGEIRSLHKLGKEIEKVKSDISNMTTSLQTYDVRAISGVGESSSNENQQYQQWVRQTYAHEVEEYFVGMQNDITQLVSLVTGTISSFLYGEWVVWGRQLLLGRYINTFMFNVVLTSLLGLAKLNKLKSK